MITQIIMSPPSKPPTAPQASTSSAQAQTSSDVNPASANSTDSTTPSDFKQALHAARGKHKAAQAPQTSPQTPAKKTATAKATVKTVAKVTPPVEEDDDQAENTNQTEAGQEEAAAETVAKNAAETTPPPQAAKATGKKNAASTSEGETEPSGKETAEQKPEANIVQAITPDAHQSGGRKQQKNGEKAEKKVESVPTGSVPSAGLNPVNPTVPKADADADIDAHTETEKSATPVLKVQSYHFGENQPAIKPRSTRSPKNSGAQQTDADANSNADAVTDTTAASATAAASDTDPGDSSVSNSTPAISAAPAAPAPSVAPAITGMLDSLGAVLPTHSPEPVAAATPVSPTRAFADANQEQIVTTIKGQLLPDGGTMQITLQPANLGHVHISVQVSGGSVSATFETTDDQATRLLSHNLGQLKQTLESAGVNVEKLQVTQIRDSNSSSQSQSDAKQSSQEQTTTDQRSSQQERQRQEILQQMWDKIAGAQDWIDVKA